MCVIYTFYETRPSLPFVFDYPMKQRHIPEELNPQLRTAERQNSPIKMHTFAPDVTSLHRLTWKQPASRDRQLVYTTLTSQRWIFIRFSTPSRMISLSKHQRLPKWRLEVLQCVWQAIVRCELVADRLGSYSIYMRVVCPQTSCYGIPQVFFNLTIW